LNDSLTSAGKPPFHYAWIIAGVGFLTVFACLGLGRFSLGMLLPSMGNSLSLSYAEMGFISTSNFIGYLFAVLACKFLMRRYDTRWVITGGLALIALTMLLISLAQDFYPLLVLYILTGLGSGAANVPVMGLVGHWFARSLRGRAAGLMVIGSGFAIMTTGILVPAINAAHGSEGWRTSWLILGGVVSLITVLASIYLRNAPDAIGLTPCGSLPPDRDRAAPGPILPGVPGKAPGRPIWILAALYFLFGCTYVIYITFIVTTLINDHGFSEGVAGQFWFWVGFLSLFSGPAFGVLSDRAGRRIGIASVFSFHALAYLMAGLAGTGFPNAAIYASVALFGLAAWSIPGIIAASVGDYLEPQQAAAAFGTLTFIFGIGQIVGPTVAGIMAEHSGSFSDAYLIASALAGAAIVLAFRLPPPAPER
jgi:MFS family permease